MAFELPLHGNFSGRMKGMRERRVVVKVENVWVVCLEGATGLEWF